MTTYGGAEAWIQEFLHTALDGSKCLASRPAHFIPGGGGKLHLPIPCNAVWAQHQFGHRGEQ
jgi:hypothetical protein